MYAYAKINLSVLTYLFFQLNEIKNTIYIQCILENPPTSKIRHQSHLPTPPFLHFQLTGEEEIEFFCELKTLRSKATD